MRWLAVAFLALAGCTVSVGAVAELPSDTVIVGDQLFWYQASGFSLHATNRAGILSRTVAAAPLNAACALRFNSSAIFWGGCNDGPLWRATLHGDNPAPLSFSAPPDFAVDENNVYFFDWTSCSLVKQPLSGTTPTPLSTGLEYLGITPYGGDLYFVARLGVISCSPVDQAKTGIYRVSISGGDSAQLVSDPYVNALLVDASGIYWSSSGSLKKAQLDGSTVTELGPSGAGDLNLVNGRLFWHEEIGYDDHSGSIVSINIDGTDRRVHYTSDGPWLVGPAVDATRIYIWESDAAGGPADSPSAFTYHLVIVSY